jgi:hypothetical protein
LELPIVLAKDCLPEAELTSRNRHAQSPVE